MNEIPWLGRWRIGNFFVPFSLEQVTNDRFNLFLERSIPTTGVFAADREVGMAVYNCTDDQNLSWAFGAFFDSQHGAQFAGAAPYSNFFWVPGCHGSGAWEFKIRTSYLDLSEVNGGRYNDLTTGFNWYWTDRIRVMFDWIHPWTSEKTVFGATSSDILAMRFDFNW